jgi:alkyl hydroperoxide reductase subunit AhpC
MRNNLGAHLFIIANNTSKDLLRQHIQRFSIDLPLYYDPIANKADNLGALNSYDDVLIVDSQGKLKSIIYKPQSIEEIKSAIAAMNYASKQMNQQPRPHRLAKSGE